MAITASALRGVVNRMLDRIKPGAKMPDSVGDDRFIETLTMLLDAIAPEEDDQQDEFNVPILNMPTGDLELSARMRGGSRVSKADIGRAKFFMAFGYEPPR